MHLVRFVGLQPTVISLRARRTCRFTTYRHRFARAAPAPRAKRNEIRRIVDVHRPSSAAPAPRAKRNDSKNRGLVAVIPDPRAARSLRFSLSLSKLTLLSLSLSLSLSLVSRCTSTIDASIVDVHRPSRPRLGELVQYNFVSRCDQNMFHNAPLTLTKHLVR